MQPFELGGSFESFNDPSGSPLIKLNRNGSIYCQSLDVVNPAGALPSISVSPIGLANGTATANNGAAYGPDTPGTTTSGIQEAINASNQVINLSLQAGIFKCTGQIILPNTTGVTSFKMVGAGLNATFIEYIGAVAQDFVVTSIPASAANPNGSFNLNLSFYDLTFLYAPNNKNYIMNITQVQIGSFINVGWQYPSLTFPVNAPVGVIGLKISPYNGNQIEFFNCMWQSLAVGVECVADHMKFFGCYWAGCGVYNSGSGNVFNATTYAGNLYAVGAAVFINPPVSRTYLFSIEFCNCHWFLNGASVLDNSAAPPQAAIPEVVGGFSESSNYDVLSVNNTVFLMWNVRRDGTNVSGSVTTSGVISAGFSSLFRTELWNGNINVLTSAGTALSIPQGANFVFSSSNANLAGDGSGNVFIEGGGGGVYLGPAAGAANRVEVSGSGISQNGAGGTAVFATSATGQVTKGNGLSLIGTGVPMSVTDGAVIGQNSNQNIFSYTPPAAVGLYRINATIETLSGTNTGTIALQITYHNFNGTAITATLPLSNTSGAMVTSGTGSSTVFLAVPPLIVCDTSATAIVCKVVVTGTVSFNAYALLEELT